MLGKRACAIAWLTNLSIVPYKASKDSWSVLVLGIFGNLSVFCTIPKLQHGSLDQPVLRNSSHLCNWNEFVNQLASSLIALICIRASRKPRRPKRRLHQIRQYFARLALYLTWFSSTLCQVLQACHIYFAAL